MTRNEHEKAVETTNKVLAVIALMNLQLVPEGDSYVCNKGDISFCFYMDTQFYCVTVMFPSPLPFSKGKLQIMEFTLVPGKPPSVLFSKGGGATPVPMEYKKGNNLLLETACVVLMDSITLE